MERWPWRVSLSEVERAALEPVSHTFVGPIEAYRAAADASPIHEWTRFDPPATVPPPGGRGRTGPAAPEQHGGCDQRLGKLMLDPQSIGRVLLNLINNALYSINEKRKRSDEEYEPTLMVTTKKIPPSAEGWPTLEIRISDNGMGVADPILSKIFQPFFTTKGPGQGTGLGLSLAYDIVNKEHVGQIDVDTHEGEYAEFIIRLPIRGNL